MPRSMFLALVLICFPGAGCNSYDVTHTDHGYLAYEHGVCNQYDVVEFFVGNPFPMPARMAIDLAFPADSSRLRYLDHQSPPWRKLQPAAAFADRPLKPHLLDLCRELMEPDKGGHICWIVGLNPIVIAISKEPSWQRSRAGLRPWDRYVQLGTFELVTDADLDRHVTALWLWDAWDKGKTTSPRRIELGDRSLRELMRGHRSGCLDDAAMKF